MLIRLLGPVEIFRNGEWVTAGSPKQRCVLSALALNPGKPLTTDALARRVWGDGPPTSARGVIYGHITRIRALFESLPDVTLARANADGYRLDIATTEIDVHVMRTLVSRAQTATDQGDHARARDLLADAQNLCQGSALSGLSSAWAARTRQRLDREQLAIAIDRFDAELHLGRHDEILAELTDLGSRHPLSEPVAAKLMLALYRGGRAADALAAYTEIRARLAEAFGTEPGEELRSLHQQMLQQDPKLSAVPTPVPPPAAPAQLPATTDSFTGRDADLARMREQVHGGHRRGGNVVVAVDGMAGIGKTAFAVHLATELRPEYPDGQLFVDLHGYSPSLPPLPVAEALARLLHGIGVPIDEVGDSADERAAAFRSALDDRRMLIVLDNAVDEDQVAPLLPGVSRSLVLVTSRRRLAGLDDTQLLTLDVLHRADAIRLFKNISGRHVSDTDTRVTELIDLCGRLPLAIRIAATRLRSRRTETLDRLRDRIADESRRLSELEAGRRSVAATFEASFQGLGERQRLGFARLGAIPGTDFDLDTAAAALDDDADTVEPLLNELLELHLIGENDADRFGFHDLLRLYAQQLAEEHAADVHDRVATHYLDMATGVSARLTPHTRVGRPHHTAGGIDSHEQARTWLEVERGNLLALINAVSDTGPHRHAWLLADEIGEHYLYRGHLTTVERAMAAGMAAARASDDVRGRALMHYGLGRCGEFRGQHDDAHDLFQQALTEARNAGDTRCQSRILKATAGIHYRLGRLEQAVDCCRQAVELDTAAGVESSPALFNTLGVIAMDQGRLRQAADHLRRAAETEARYPSGNIHIVQCSRSMVHCQLGELDAALDYAANALETCREIGARKYEPVYLSALSKVYLAYGDNAKAYELAQQGHDAAVDAGPHYVVTRCLLTMAQARLDNPDEAIRLAEEAAALAVEQHLNLVEVETRLVLAEAKLRAGESDKAHDHATTAVAESQNKRTVVTEAWALTVLAESQYAVGQSEAGGRTAAEALRHHESIGHAAMAARTRELLKRIEASASLTISGAAGRRYPVSVSARSRFAVRPAPGESPSACPGWWSR